MMIDAQQLTRHFTSGSGKKTTVVEAVRELDLQVAEGELVAILGPNGAGKSTTLRMLTTLLPPTSGSARVAGVDVTVDPAAVRQRIGYIGQGNGAGHSYRVDDELHMQGRFYGLGKAETKAKAAQLMEVLDLDGLSKRKVSTLSGGQRRRLDIAMGLLHEPNLLFLDEPSTGMDPQNRANLWDHVRKIRAERGSTIVLTTHYLDEADTMAERVVVIDEGRVIADDTPERLKVILGGDRIAFGVDISQASAAEPIARSYAREGEVERTDGDPVRFALRSESGSARLPRLLADLDHAGVDVRFAAVNEPTLDDVFLNLTGRSLREND